MKQNSHGILPRHPSIKIETKRSETSPQQNQKTYQKLMPLLRLLTYTHPGLHSVLMLIQHLFIQVSFRHNVFLSLLSVCIWDWEHKLECEAIQWEKAPHGGWIAANKYHLH